MQAPWLRARDGKARRPLRLRSINWRIAQAPFPQARSRLCVVLMGTSLYSEGKDEMGGLLLLDEVLSRLKVDWRIRSRESMSSCSKGKIPLTVTAVFTAPMRAVAQCQAHGPGSDPWMSLRLADSCTSSLPARSLEESSGWVAPEANKET